MKTKLLFALCALIITGLPAQKIQQWSNVREQNSNNKVIPNAQVVFEGGIPVSSDQSGKLRLVFNGKKPGQYVFFKEVVKEGYELVNLKQIEQVVLTDDDHFAVDIILAQKGKIETARKEYYQISDKNLQKAHNTKKSMLRKELEAARLSNQEFEKKMATLQKNYDDQRKELGIYAEKFARVNFDDVGPVYEEALNLFMQGKIDEAIAKLEGADPAKRTEQLIKEGKSIENQERDLVKRKAAFAKEKTKQIDMVFLLIDMYTLKFEFEKAEAQYDELLRMDDTDIKILLKAGAFYVENFRDQKALHVIQKLQQHPQRREEDRMAAIQMRSSLYNQSGLYQKALEGAEQYMQFANVKFQRDTANNNYRLDLAKAIRTVAQLQLNLGNIDESIKIYTDVFDLVEKKHDKFSKDNTFEKAMAVAYTDLGFAYNMSDRPVYKEKAKEFLKHGIYLKDAMLRVRYSEDAELALSKVEDYRVLGTISMLEHDYKLALGHFSEAHRTSWILCQQRPNDPRFRLERAISAIMVGAVSIMQGFDKHSNLIVQEEGMALLYELNTEYPYMWAPIHQIIRMGYSTAETSLFCGQLVDGRNSLIHNQTTCQNLLRTKSIWSTQQYNFIKSIQERTESSLSELEQAHRDVYVLTDRIQSESDPQVEYQLYGMLCDLLRRKAASEPGKYNVELSIALNNRAWNGLLLQKFEAAEAELREGLALNVDNNYLPSNLAPALLLQGKREEAFAEYNYWKKKFLVQNALWLSERMEPRWGRPAIYYSTVFLEDLDLFEKAGIIPAARRADVAAVRKLLSGK